MVDESQQAAKTGRTWRFWGAWLLILTAGVLWYRKMEPKAPVAPPELSRTPGVRLFYRYECGRCHSLTGVPGAEGKMGPALDHVGSRAASRVPGKSAETYLRESLVKPQAFVVEGYLKTMPAYPLREDELKELTEYLIKQP